MVVSVRLLMYIYSDTFGIMSYQCVHMIGLLWPFVHSALSSTVAKVAAFGTVQQVAPIM